MISRRGCQRGQAVLQDLTAPESRCVGAVPREPLPIRLLGELSTVAPGCERSVSDLVADIDRSRSCIDRSLRTLTALEAVRDDDGYVITGVGQALRALYRYVTNTLSNDDADFLFRSANRPQLLAAMRQEPVSPHDLAALEPMPSRKTVQRGLTDCRERGWIVETTNREYKLTEAGADVASTATRAVRAAHQITTQSQFVRGFGRSFPAFPYELLADTEMVTTTASNPTAVVDTIAEIGSLADVQSGASPARIQTLLPSCSPLILDLLHGHAENGTEVAVIYDADVAAAIEEREPPQHRRLVGHPDVTVRTLSESLSESLTCTPETAILMSHSPGAGDAGVVGDDNDLVEWTSATLDTYWRRTNPVPEVRARM